ncbi:hypothetical protein Tco_0479575, partial [Tanacetum coccineum]
SMSRSPEPRRDRSRSTRRKDLEREMVFRRLEKGVFHRLDDKEKGMSTYSGVQGVSHVTTAAETPRAIIRIPAREERSPLLRGIMIEKHTHVREKRCKKVKTVQEDIGNLNLRSKSQV